MENKTAKTPEEMLSRGEGRFINCTDYGDAIKAMYEYASLAVEEKEREIKELKTQLSLYEVWGEDKDGKYSELYCETLKSQLTEAKTEIERLKEGGREVEFVEWIADKYKPHYVKPKTWTSLKMGDYKEYPTAFVLNQFILLTTNHP